MTSTLTPRWVLQSPPLQLHPVFHLARPTHARTPPAPAVFHTTAVGPPPPHHPGALLSGVQGDSATFVARYSYEAHIKGITALGLAGKTLVSGGADEFIK